MDNPVLMFKRGLLVEPSKINEAVAFYKNVFDAEEVPPPTFAAAELKMANSYYLIMHLPSHISVNDEGDNKMTTMIEFDNIVAAVQGAVSAGTVLEQVEENMAAMYAGRPIAKIRDPFGFSWYILNSTSGTRTSLPQFM